MIKIISTPIGNFKDITLNALEALKNADVILCEDTRKTDSLLKQHNISGKKLLIYNEHTTEKELNHFTTLAKEQTVCVVSDAGTPLICDPGFSIVSKARQNAIEIEICGGVCSLIVAATLCGINIQNMLFLGFFSEKNTIKTPKENITYSYFAAPHDVLKLLQSLQFEFFTPLIKIAKDLTKTYQQNLEFESTKQAIKHFQEHEPKGEFVFFLQFKQKTAPILTNELELILNTLPNWETIGKKNLANFLQTHCQSLQSFTSKEIYNALQTTITPK